MQNVTVPSEHLVQNTLRQGGFSFDARGFKVARVVVCHGDIEGGADHVLRVGCAAHRAIVLRAATNSLPVPRQAISAGLKFGQRQAFSGTSRQWS